MTVLAAALAFAAASAQADDYQDAVDSAHAQLDKFEEWVDQQTETLKAEIAELQKELANSTADDKDRIDGMLEQADALTDDLRAQADQIGTATSDQWDEVKANVLGGWHRTQAAYYAALAELRDKD
jgi:DNA anti-recombination protein RmuC